MPLSNFAPEQYEQLLADKVEVVQNLLAAYQPPEASIFPSAPSAFRMRAEFRLWHQGDELHYVMFRPGEPKTPIVITQFPIACEAIQSLMPVLLKHLQSEPLLRHKIFQVEFLSTLSGDTLITLVYHRKLDEAWLEQATELASQLGIHIVGRSRKQKLVPRQDYVTEILPVAGREFYYRQYEQAFTQPNAQLNIQMLEWALDATAALSGDLLELYCGNGNFTLPLAQHFDQVIATELSKTSIRAARWNLERNGIENVQMIRLSAEEVSQAIAGTREFRRLADLPQALGSYDLRTVFVDPPRAGLDPATTAMVAQFEHILYISCNPQSLADNLATLCKTHEIERFALFDQFPYTHHMECGVLLRQKQLS
ncbi:tRNA (uridine(54)-C5)-methyltransferase TrmA [Parahaliea sp. F7430]|uniref:tRNA/tmRNA (uracil-C(5))-methyltransferase n=1 Tax=Sediminihaliea albiluteola TaxID=2758564 RepID=A0A7W2TUF0_9GAMM|nr:tRNA (uridine(54)-C5)-methyltransferase TrmA [Sediminihaliea albiluteola]MBA6412164.1 tRNA (uridine(54)-C5)-methyltransferase TrmA [Sediminihaliea albiluteola]